MGLIFFSKPLKDYDIGRLIACAHEWGIDGYDLCVRPEYVVNPENAPTMLPQLADEFRKEGLSVPMVTGNFDLLEPDHPTAVPILTAMDQADVRLLKLGYFKFQPREGDDYWSEVDRIRGLFEGWQELAEKYNVKVCYHTHSYYCMGLNCAAIMHLLKGFDPERLGAYIDTGHMVVEGEAFDVGVGMVGEYLSIVALKDMVKLRKGEGEGYQAETRARCVAAGKGLVDWDLVFSELARVGYDGPFSVHAEYKKPSEEEYIRSLADEFDYFRSILDK